MNTDTTKTIVLSGAGPRITVTSASTKPVKVLVANKNSVKTLRVSDSTDVKFAA